MAVALQFLPPSRTSMTNKMLLAKQNSMEEEGESKQLAMG